MVTVHEGGWLEEASCVDQSYSPSLLTTTVTSLVICLATCFKTENTKAATYNKVTSICDCYDSLTTMTSLTGNHLWSRQFNDYIHSHSPWLYVKIVADQWLTHPAADAVCAADGGRLIVLDTEAKRTYIIGLLGVLYNNYYHIGATDEVVESEFVWKTGGAVSQDSSIWAPFQPDNYLGNQNCLVLYEYKYDDAFCSDIMNFICELV